MPELHDIVLPEAPSFWPATPAAYAVLALLVALVVGAALALARRHRRDRYRRLALAELSEIERRGAYHDLPALVKRTALQAAPRDEVASLSGEAWLRYLDASYGGDGFTRGPGRRLPELAYAGVDAADVSDLMNLVHQWIQKHERHDRV